MKKKIFIAIGVVLLAVIGYVVYGVLTSSKLSPSEDTGFSYDSLDIKVVYCRPYKKGRLIFGDEKDGALVPNGKYWRLGANDATEITFTKKVNFAGQPVNAGSYRMYAVPGATSWQIVLNSELGKFGFFEPNYDLDVLRIEVPVGSLPSVIEQFTIRFSSEAPVVNMDLAWDKTLIRVPITLQ